jgi:hypothetical protein
MIDQGASRVLRAGWLPRHHQHHTHGTFVHISIQLCTLVIDPRGVPPPSTGSQAAQGFRVSSNVRAPCMVKYGTRPVLTNAQVSRY